MLASVLAATLTVGLMPTELPALAQSAGQKAAVQGEGGDPAAATTDEALTEAKRSGKSVEVASLRGESSESSPPRRGT